MRYLVTALALAFGLAASIVLPPGLALAHEHRDVGPYELTVGWLTEPSLRGEPNGIDLRIVDKATQQPVEGAEKTLKAMVAFGGGQPKEFPLRARFRMPGAYTADIIPTRPGGYVFTFTGDINGQPVNEKFESGPGRFDDVKAATDIQFPAAEPSTAQLQQALADASQQAATATTMAIAGLVVAVLSLALAGYLILTRRSTGEARALAARGSQAD